MVPAKVPPPGLNYATVEKRRAKGRVVEIVTRVIFGTMAAVLAALSRSKVSRWITVAFLERQNATDRHHNARKVRKRRTHTHQVKPSTPKLSSRWNVFGCFLRLFIRQPLPKIRRRVATIRRTAARSPTASANSQA